MLKLKIAELEKQLSNANQGREELQIALERTITSSKED